MQKNQFQRLSILNVMTTESIQKGFFEVKWIAKASLQKSLSLLPAGDKVNYMLQRKVTKGLPVSDGQFYEKVLLARRHYNTFLKYNPAHDVFTAAFYEFGAGWDLITPLTFHALGINSQTLVDIRANIHIDLINDTLHRLSIHKKKLEQLTGASFRDMHTSPIRSITELESRFGIAYLAPCDASNTGLPAESYDFISNTSTMEHIPENSLPGILLECARLLKQEGIMSSIIDMKDHYSYHDSRISCYNFLKFSDATWNLIDSPLHFQNRLRYPDYKKLFAISGLEIVAQDIQNPSAKELAALSAIQLSSRFQGSYSLEDLGAKTAHIVSRKGNTLQF